MPPRPKPAARPSWRSVLRVLAPRISQLAPLLAILLATPAAADTWIDTHDDPAPAWQIDTSGGARQLKRERVRVPGQLAGEETGAERLVYAAPPGASAWAWRIIPPAAVIDELRLQLEGRVPVPGAFLAAEIVLPNTAEEGEEPIRLRIRSAPAASAKQGEVDLMIANTPQLLQREVRVWRLANRGKPINPRGAYVSRLALVLPGTGRPSPAWVREVSAKSLVTPLQRTPVGVVARAADPEQPASKPGGRVRLTRVTLHSDGFRVDDELYFPRIWRWRGESFQSLASRGVNTVWLDRTPTPQALAEAAHYRLRLLCPPPTSPAEARAYPSTDRVLAWVLEGPLTERDLDPALAKIEAVRELRGSAARPVLAHVGQGAAAWSRVVDGLLLQTETSRISPPPEATDLEASVPPGTPLLAVAPLDVGDAVAGQLDALLGDGVAPTWLPPGDVSRRVEQAIRRGANGVLFTSAQRLDGADDATLAAAGWVEAINRRLRLLEPWLVGSRATYPLTPDPGVLLDRGGVRLAAIDSLLDPSDTGAPTLLLPGLSTTARVLRMTPAGLHTWEAAREAGGAGARRPGGAKPGDLLVSNDPRVVRSLRAYTAQSSQAAAKNLATIAATSLTQSEALTPERRRRADGLLAEAQLAASRRDHAAAYDAAHGVLALISQAENQRRRIAQTGTILDSTPLAVLPGTLTDHFRMTQLLAASPRGPNRLFGGSFEDIDELRTHGWRHTRPTSDGEHATVELAGDPDAVHGERVLRLRGAAVGARIESPDLDLLASQTVEVTGWARVEGAGGALVVTDSLGGVELSLRIGDTAGEWKPFRLLRATRVDTTIGLTLATAGRVVADVDGLMLRAIEPTGVAKRQATTTK
ncbi:hypothetical protein MalM25_11450 [Planctomycetes bacterium MalM25]|nr:hypothetical protein MalM25_11450 [Planctomycetes bacterium MalM25]